MSEIDFINRLKSLTINHTSRYPNSLGLNDDICVLGMIDGQTLIASSDCVCENIHFFHNDPLDLIVKKAIRTNISDIACKGAVPYGIMFNICLPKRYHNTVSTDLIFQALHDDLSYFNVPLLGGDTTSGETLTISITIFGLCRHNIPHRKNVQLHDNIYVTGTLGLSKIGLDLCKKVPEALSIKGDTQIYKNAYLLPSVCVATGITFAPFMNASMDISDGLLGDLQKMVNSSPHILGFTLDNTQIPIADITDKNYALNCALYGGDDYQILFTSPADSDMLFDIASNIRIKLSKIGIIDNNIKNYSGFIHL